jgi:2,3-bisphosphoglycerate-dependent phosphoglycerate mutase
VHWNTRLMGSEVVLVRHAQSVIPRAGGPGDYQRPLAEEGMAQAERLVADLAGVHPVLVASSPYLRAVQTVEPLARAMGMPVRTEEDLREWDSGIEPTPDYVRHYTESWADPQFARPGAESLHQLTDRATATVARLAGENPDGIVVIGSHGTFICRALVGFGLTGVDWSFSRAMPMPAIYRLHLSGGKIEATGPGL